MQYVYLLNKYLKCSVWRLALRYDIYTYVYIYMSLGFKTIKVLITNVTHNWKCDGAESCLFGAT